jgi:hypothetical protein
MSSDHDRPSSSSSDDETPDQRQERAQLIREPPLNPNRPMHADTRAAFNPPQPSRLSRAALLVGLIFLIWVAAKLGQWGQATEPQIIYANRLVHLTLFCRVQTRLSAHCLISRYSDEHKYRPAASPVITETLRDGRIRLRGANVAGVGIQQTDVPKTPRQIANERKEKEQKALDEAKIKLGLKKKLTKEQERKRHEERLAKKGVKPGPGPGSKPGAAKPGKRASGQKDKLGRSSL